MTYPEAIQYLYQRLAVFHHVGASAYKPGLDNTIRLLGALGNPHTRYKTIHIAGTNGKGSVSHMMASVLQESGYKTGLYTSPHLVDFGERVRVDGTMISQEYVVDFVETHQALFAEIQPSFFEATMAMAFAYFAHCGVDVAVIEVGLGGRLDSTNIICPELSVITNISFDHTGFLGSSLEQIAGEKAGIIKKNTPVVVGEYLPETRPVFQQKADEMNAPLIFAEDVLQVVSYQYVDDKMQVSLSDGKSYKAGLTGTYQLKNIVTTLVAVEQLQQRDFLIPRRAIDKGVERVIENTGLQGRWQVAGEHPKIVLDTGHNTGGIAWVVRQLKEQTYSTLRIVIGMVNDKDISTVLSLLPREALYYFTQANIERALPADELMRIAYPYGLMGKAYTTVQAAIHEAVADADADDFIFVGGSNFVVGEALEALRKR